MKISQKLSLNSLVLPAFLVLNAAAVFLVQRMMNDARLAEVDKERELGRQVATLYQDFKALGDEITLMSKRSGIKELMAYGNVDAAHMLSPPLSCNLGSYGKRRIYSDRWREEV